MRGRKLGRLGRRRGGGGGGEGGGGGGALKVAGSGEKKEQDKLAKRMPVTSPCADRRERDTVSDTRTQTPGSWVTPSRRTPSPWASTTGTRVFIHRADKLYGPVHAAVRGSVTAVSTCGSSFCRLGWSVK